MQLLHSVSKLEDGEVLDNIKMVYSAMFQTVFFSYKFSSPMTFELKKNLQLKNVEYFIVW